MRRPAVGSGTGDVAARVLAALDPRRVAVGDGQGQGNPIPYFSLTFYPQYCPNPFFFQDCISSFLKSAQIGSFENGLWDIFLLKNMLSA